MVRMIFVSPVRQKGNIGGDSHCSFTIRVRETSRWYNWYRRAVSMGAFKIRRTLEIPDKRLGTAGG